MSIEEQKLQLQEIIRINEIAINNRRVINSKHDVVFNNVDKASNRIKNRVEKNHFKLILELKGKKCSL